MDEDFIGKLMHCSQGAVHASAVSRRILERWMLNFNCWLCEAERNDECCAS